MRRNGIAERTQSHLWMIIFVCFFSFFDANIFKSIKQKSTRSPNTQAYTLEVHVLQNTIHNVVVTKINLGFAALFFFFIHLCLNGCRRWELESATNIVNNTILLSRAFLYYYLNSFLCLQAFFLPWPGVVSLASSPDHCSFLIFFSYSFALRRKCVGKRIWNKKWIKADKSYTRLAQTLSVSGKKECIWHKGAIFFFSKSMIIIFCQSLCCFLNFDFQ